MLALCQHNTLAHYAFYYAGIFDEGLLGVFIAARQVILTPAQHLFVSCLLLLKIILIC